MNLLLCLANRNYIVELVEHFHAEPQPHTTLPFITSVKINHHQVHLLHSGPALFETAYRVTKALSIQKYHLAIKISYGMAYHPATPNGTVLNIINEKPGDFGKLLNNQWTDLYDANLLDSSEAPHRRGGLINLTNSYMNVFLPFQKAVGLTVNQIQNTPMMALRNQKYNPHCETTDGLGFAYPCLSENQAYYHLCITSPTSHPYPNPLPSPKTLITEILEKL